MWIITPSIQSTTSIIIISKVKQKHLKPSITLFFPINTQTQQNEINYMQEKKVILRLQE